MVFGLLKKAVTANLNKYTGNKDFLEAVGAACALVASADGNISDDEVVTAVEVARSNEKLGAAYSQAEIEAEFDRQLRRAKTATGRAALARELDDVARKDAEIRQDVYLIALDVASADGDIGKEEQVALSKIAARLGINPAQLGL